MAYRLTWTATVSWIGPGMGPVSSSPLPNPDGNAQSRGFVPAVVITGAGLGASGAINATDITAMTNAMAADLALQMSTNGAFQVMQNWPTGAG